LLKTFESVPEVDRPVRVVRSGFHLGSGDPGPASAPPALGADTKDLLAELGYSQREVDELAREGAI
jgi:formyl-CoA transferase